MDDQTAREIAELARKNGEIIKRESLRPHPWDEWGIEDDPTLLCPECGQTFAHYHRETADGSEIVRG